MKMRDAVKTVKMKNGMVGYIVVDGDCQTNPITDWDNVPEINIWSSRHISYYQSEFFSSEGIPTPDDIYSAVEYAMSELPADATDAEVAAEIGYGNVITWDVFAEALDKGEALTPEGYRLLSRSVAYLETKYWWNAISQYEHGSVSYYLGHPSCRWDGGYCGIAVVDLEKHAVDLKTKCRDGSVNPDERAAEYARGLLETYTDACNGEVYGWVIEDASGDEVDSCWGYIGEKWAEEALHDHIEAYENDVDYSVLELGGVEHRATALAAVIAKLGSSFCDRVEKWYGLHRFFDVRMGKYYLYTEDHNRVVDEVKRIVKQDKDAPTGDIAEYCCVYGEAYMSAVRENLVR